MGNYLKKNNKIQFSTKDFTILEKLGEGATGIVYKVKPHSSIVEYFPNENYAMKVFKSSYFAYPNALERLEREKKLLISIKGQNQKFVQEYEWFNLEDDEKFYLTHYFCGKNLLEWRKVNSSEPNNSIVAIFLQILEGVVFLHKNGIFHRDLKPENILFDGQQVKICDFGVAKRENDNNLTFSNDFLGTIQFSAPEYLFHGKYTIFSEFYSLGHILYFLITGETFIPSGSQAMQILDVKTKKFKALSESAKFKNQIIFSWLIFKLTDENEENRLINPFLIEALVRLDNLPNIYQESILELINSDFNSFSSYNATSTTLYDYLAFQENYKEPIEEKFSYFQTKVLPIFLDDYAQFKEHPAFKSIIKKFRIDLILSPFFLNSFWFYHCQTTEGRKAFIQKNIIKNLKRSEFQDQEKILIWFLIQFETDQETSEMLKKCFEVDNELIREMRHFFIENGDFGDDDAYTILFGFNDFLRDH